MAQRINQKNVTRKKKHKPYKLQWTKKWGSTWHFCYLALVASLACGTLRLGKWIKEKDKVLVLVELVGPWMKNLFIVDDPKSKKRWKHRERERGKQKVLGKLRLERQRKRSK